MLREKGVVPLASDLSDEEPADLLLRVVARVRDGSIVAGSQKRHVREDLLVHSTLDQAVGSCAPLGDDGRALGVGALKPVYRPGPHLTRLDDLHPGNPAGQRAIGLELAPRPNGGVRQQVLQASPRRGWRALWRRLDRTGLAAVAGRPSHDPPSLEREDGGAARERGGAMADDDHGAAPLETLQRVHDRRFGSRIDSARRLVQDEHRAVLQEGAGDGDALALAARELNAAFAHLGVVAPRKPDDELVSVRRVGRRLQFVFGGPGLRVGDVLGDGGREEH